MGWTRCGGVRRSTAFVAWLLGAGALAWALGVPPFGTPAHAGHAAMVNALDVDYIRAQYERGRKLAAVDLRSRDEYRHGHLPGAQSLPMDQLTTRFQEVPRTDLVVLYCDCSRSEVERAYWFLRQQGYRNLSVLESGFAAWAQRGYPVER